MRGSLTEQAIDLYTVAQEGGLWFIALAKQPSQQGELDPVFNQMMGSVAFLK